jgi:enoyl-CoA hydratase/carnithine racemase
VNLRTRGRFDRHSAERQGAGGNEAFLLNPQPLPARTAYEWGVVAEVVANGKAVARARELADLYLPARASIR